MPQIKDFDDAHRLLNQFIPESSQLHKFSLESMTKLMKYLGDPQDKLKIIHVAGTSGKTSTCYYIAALLTAAGKKVGLTVSPYVDEVNERVQINLKPLGETTFCHELGKFIDIVSKSQVKPSYFELLIAFAYWYFANQKVDFAVVEVGLGGLMDGTNVIHRQDKTCVITDIGLDHTHVLGNTIGEIAAQKAGIIGSHNPVFMYKQSQEVMESLVAQCTKEHAQLHELTTQQLLSQTQHLPPFQQRNFYLAKTAAEYVADEQLTESQIGQAARTVVPARMEVVKHKGKTLIIDGSHNGQKMQALAEGIQKLYPNQPTAALVSFVDGEEGRAKGALEELVTVTNSLIVTSFSGEQDAPKHSLEPNQIANIAKQIGFAEVDVTNDPKAAFEKLLKRPEQILVVTGSFYLLNHIRPLILKK